MATGKPDAWSLFLTAHALVVEEIEKRLSAADLPPLAWYDALWALERAPEGTARMYEMAERMVIARYNLTRLMDRIEAAGLVERFRSEEDRRATYARLTPRAARCAARCGRYTDRPSTSCSCRSCPNRSRTPWPSNSAISRAMCGRCRAQRPAERRRPAPASPTTDPARSAAAGPGPAP